jgi:hypothetical protein
MKLQKYSYPHMLERADEVKRIWIKQYERERRSKISSLLTTMVAYCIGFWSGSIGHTVNFMFVTLAISVVVWYGLRYLRVNYKINI